MTEEDWAEIHQDIAIDFMKDSYFTELKEYEILRERLDTLDTVQQHIGDYYSREWVRKNILQQTDKDIKRQDKAIQKERELGLIKDDTGGF